MKKFKVECTHNEDGLSTIDDSGRCLVCLKFPFQCAFCPAWYRDVQGFIDHQCPNALVFTGPDVSGNSHRLELRKVVIHRRLSEETIAFSADIYFDGMLVGYTKNHGHGASNSYSWRGRAIGQMIENWAERQTLKYDFEKLDQIVCELLIQSDQRKAMKRWMKSKTCFRLVGDARGSWRTVQAVGPRALEFISRSYGDKVEIVLSEENLAKAVAL